MGFCVADIEGNEDCPFGMVGDVLENPQCRGRGLGDTLLQTAVSWLRSKGIRDILNSNNKTR